MQVTNPKLTHSGTKIIQKIEDMRSHAGAWERGNNYKIIIREPCLSSAIASQEVATKCKILC